MNRARLLLLNSLLLLTLLGAYFGRRNDHAGAAETDFLRPLPLPFRGWKTEDQVVTPGELKLLEPDALLIRTYQGEQNGWAQLAVIAGHRKKSIHTPSFCMLGGGWDVLTQHNTQIRTSGRAIPASRMLMSKDGQRILVTYYFTNGDFCTSDLVQFQSLQMLQRFQARAPLGALIRVIVPVLETETEAVALTDEFAQATLPPVMTALREARRKMR